MSEEKAKPSSREASPKRVRKPKIADILPPTEVPKPKKKKQPAKKKKIVTAEPGQAAEKPKRIVPLKKKVPSAKADDFIQSALALLKSGQVGAATFLLETLVASPPPTKKTPKKKKTEEAPAN